MNKVNREEYEQIEQAASMLQRNNSIMCSKEIEKTQKYHEGYNQGIEDLLKCIRRGD